MHDNQSQQHLHYQRGFSLIELLISMVIGLMISLAAMSAYLGSASSGKASDAQARMNEDAQAALTILTQQLRMAGTNPVQAGRAEIFRHNPVFSPYGTTSFTISPAYTLTTFLVRGCEGTFSNITTATNTAALTCASGTTTLPDSIAVNYEADRYNTVATSGGVATDCVGNGLTTLTATMPTGGTVTANYWVADNRFYIGTSTAITSPSLYCKGNGGTTQPLVENIEDMQFTYGAMSATTTATTATVAGYLNAAEMLTQTNMAGLADDAARWSKVITVRICIVVRSEGLVATNAEAAKYDNCRGGQNVDAPDLRLRRAYSTTVVLRNRRT